ncbi:unnamed protein product [Sphagnum jensenii]|uniref:DUF7953 domain-containing protein n=1 Tax=Sphagnum jensenii TaxID=128206 RepID=A0ABP1BW05_9BRYO
MDRDAVLRFCDWRRFMCYEEKEMRNKNDLLRSLPLLIILGLSALLLSASGATADGNVTLVSLTIFTTHEWYYKPDVYFQCQGEERKDLPDVKDKDCLYKFIGEESWQPLTSLVGVKCKRCGLYEKDKIKSDDIFDEWELCPLDFSQDPDVHYFHSKDKEFNMTLSCPQCNVTKSEDNMSSPESNPPGEKRATKHGIVVAMIVIGVLSLVGLVALVAFSLWRRKQRQEAQARFVQLFEDDDFLDEEADLKDDL